MTPFAYNVEIEWDRVTVRFDYVTIPEGGLPAMVSNCLALAREQHGADSGPPHRVEIAETVSVH